MRATQKFGEREQASTRLNFASKSSKGKILRAVTNFNGPFITPSLDQSGTSRKTTTLACDEKARRHHCSACGHAKNSRVTLRWRGEWVKHRFSPNVSMNSYREKEVLVPPIAFLDWQREGRGTHILRKSRLGVERRQSRSQSIRYFCPADGAVIPVAVQKDRGLWERDWKQEGGEGMTTFPNNTHSFQGFSSL